MITTEKTCFKCGAEKPLAEFYKHKQMADGHHDDYSKQLEVRWLCAVCHHQWHAENGEAANG